jgi:hypothetical protein
MGLSSLKTSVAFAVATAGATLALAWPGVTIADDNRPLVQYTVDGTKVNDVVVKGVVERDPKAKSGWVVVVTATNTANHSETIPLETDVAQTVSNPMARVAPAPTTVWSKTETVTLSAGQAMTKRYELPANVAAKVAAANRPAKLAPNNLQPITTVFVAFERSMSPVGGAARRAMGS